MAKYFYANTWHPELFNVKDDRSVGQDFLSTESYGGKKWLKVPSSVTASIDLPTSGLKDFYVSFEYCQIPFDTQHQTQSSVNGITWNGVTNRSQIYLQTTRNSNGGSPEVMNLINMTRKIQESGYGWAGDESKNQWFAGNLHATMEYTDTSGCSGIESSSLKEKGKYCIHFFRASSSSDYIKAETTTSIGKGNKTPDVYGFGLRLCVYGFYIRNIIISEEPISFSDTIREVDVDSIAGTGWYTSNGKTYTENVNAVATVKLNSVSLAEAKKAIEARKFAFSGVTNRQGERINAIEVKRANEAHQSLVDIGEHTFGSSWSVSSPSEITDTLTLATRKVVGQ